MAFMTVCVTGTALLRGHTVEPAELSFQPQLCLGCGRLFHLSKLQNVLKSSLGDARLQPKLKEALL